MHFLFLSDNVYFGMSTNKSIIQALRSLTKEPDRTYFDSEEEGRHIYKYPAGELATDGFDLVWYSPEIWWAKFRRPKFQLGPPPGSLRWLAKGLDRKVLVHLAALLRRA